MKEKPIITLDLTMNNCIINAFLNGFPVYHYEATYKGNFSMPLNAYLITNNKLEIIISPINNNQTEDFADSIILEGAIKLYEKGEISGPEYGEIIQVISKSDFNFDIKPIKNIYNFNSEKIDFSYLFSNSISLQNDEDLINYGLYLRDIFINKELKSISKEFQPKINDFSIAYFSDYNILNKQFLDFLKNTFFNLNPILNFEKDDILIKKFCENRICELQLKKYEKFFNTSPDAENDIYTIRIFVALINDQLKVVR